MQSHRIAAGVLLAVASLVANAASYDLSFGPYSTQSDKFSNSPFTDVYNFNFTGTSGISSSSLIEYKLSKYIDIDWADTAAFTVYGGWDGTGPVLATFGDPAVGTGSFAIVDLPVPNKFSIVISGTAIGDGTSVFQPGLKGSYDFSVVAQPVPEPNATLLGLSALAVIRLLSARRKTS